MATDLQIDADGVLVISGSDLTLVEGEEEIVQSVRIRLRTFLGEWFLDTTEGLDYFGKIVGKRRNAAERRREIQRVILATQGVDSIETYTETENGTTIEIYVEVLTTEGKLARIQETFNSD